MYAPSEVSSGLACGCVCVGCSAPLVAKKGVKNRWHFAHHGFDVGESCAESAIHAAAKQVLFEHNWLRAPEMRIEVSSQSKLGRLLRETDLLSEERNIRFERSALEVWETNIRADVVGYRGERKLLIEMYFRHKVDEDKRRKLKALDLPAIEIDLSDIDVSAGFQAIIERVVYQTEFKSWLHFPNAGQVLRSLRTRLAGRVRQANAQYRAQKFAEHARLAAREKRQAEDRERRLAAALRYRQTPFEQKEQDLRQRLGIVGTWPYYLRKESDVGSVVAERAMIWQAALFARFIFRKANERYELQHSSVTQWVQDRFGSTSSLAALSNEVKRYLCYLSACGFLRKLPYNPYGSQAYVVVHGELELPASSEPQTTTVERHMTSSPVTTIPKLGEMIWIWRASWPKWEDIAERTASLLLASPHREYLMALVQELSPQNRPDNPSDCAAILETWDVPRRDVMFVLESLGLVLRKTVSDGNP